MNAVRVETTVEADGELHLTDLPCRRGDKVEAIVLILEPSQPAPNAEREPVPAPRLTPGELRKMPRPATGHPGRGGGTGRAGLPLRQGTDRF